MSITNLASAFLAIALSLAPDSEDRLERSFVGGAEVSSRNDMVLHAIVGERAVDDSSGGPWTMSPGFFQSAGKASSTDLVFRNSFETP